MDLLKKLREDHDLSDLLCDVFDVKILPEFKTLQDEGGHVTYNIAGKTFAKEIFEEYVDSAQADGVDLCEAQQKLADRLGIELKSDVTELLMRFYHCAKRNPRFIQTYTENDCSVHSGTGSLFDR